MAEHTELGYLRNEINQILGFSNEYAQKIITTVLATWGSISIAFGAAKFFDSSKFLIIYFIGATIFFVSVLILYFSIETVRNNMDSLLKIVAYIIVFYERKPKPESETKEYFSWETALLRNDIKENNNLPRNNGNSSYIVFMFISLAGVIFCSAMFLRSNGGFCGSLEVVIPSVSCVAYLLISICLFCDACKLLYFKTSKEKMKYIRRFLNYAKETGRYTEEEFNAKLKDFSRD